MLLRNGELWTVEIKSVVQDKEADMSPLPRILIVEDEDILAENLKQFLGRRSPDVRIALDAELALEMLDTFTPDLVVMDLALPGIDGIEAYAEIVRRCARQICCIMITGHPVEDVAERAVKSGIRHVLGKPFALTELQHLVERSAAECSSGPGGMSVGPYRAKEARAVAVRHRHSLLDTIQPLARLAALARMLALCCPRNSVCLICL